MVALVPPLAPVVVTPITTVVEATVSVVTNHLWTRHHRWACHHWPIRHHRGLGSHGLRAIRTCESMIIGKPVIHVIHCDHSTGTRSNGRTAPATRHQRRIAPLSWHCIVASDVISNHLVAPPRPLDHLNRFSICETAVAHWTSILRGDQGLVGLAVRTTEEVGEVTTGPTHGKPGVAACWRIVKGTSAHTGQAGC
jgi:hypothetical protein